MAVPTPRTWLAGEPWTAALMNSDVRDVLNFLLNPDACSVYLTANQSIPNNTQTLLTYTSEAYDTATMHSTGSDTSRIVAQTPGLYEVKSMVTFASVAGGSRQIQVRKNAAGASGSGTQLVAGKVAGFAASQNSVDVEKEIRLAVGDYIETFCFQDAGAGAQNAISGDELTYFSARWVAI